MKYWVLFILGATFTTQVLADNLSSCHADCFEKKVQCNVNAGFTVNSCDNNLFACKASCKSGKKQRDYANTLPSGITVPTISDLDN
jgi:hypothetical protein